MVTDGLTYALRVGYVRILESYIFPSMVETTFVLGDFSYQVNITVEVAVVAAKKCNAYKRTHM